MYCIRYIILKEQPLSSVEKKRLLRKIITKGILVFIILQKKNMGQKPGKLKANENQI